MPSAILCSMPAQGHVRPMLAVATGLLARGWRVRFLTGAAFEAKVRAAGVEFLELPAEADSLHRRPGDERHSGIASLNHGIKQIFFDPAPAEFRAVSAALRAEPADAVLHDTTFLGTAGLYGWPDGERPLLVMCGILPLGLSSRDCAPFGLGMTPMRGPIGHVRNRLLTILATKVILAPAHRQADAMLRDIGAAPLNGQFFVDLLLRDDLLAQFTVQEFEYPRSDAPANLMFFGPTAQLVPSNEPLPPWWSELDGSRPVVHVSQGTVANTDFDELIRPTLTALADEDVTVVVTTGGPPVAELGPLPANALAAEFIPHDKLLPRTDVFVTNGGYGALHYAMATGTPVVVAGDTEDKPETSARVGWSGIGINLKTGRPKSGAILKAVRKVLADNRYAETSASIGRAIERSPGVDGLADVLETMIADRRPSARE